MGTIEVDRVSIEDLDKEEIVWVDEFKAYLYVKNIYPNLNSGYTVVFEIMDGDREKEVMRTYTNRKTFITM